MDKTTSKQYLTIILGCITALVIVMSSIVTAKDTTSGANNLSYREFIMNSILKNFSGYWLLVIVTVVVCLICIFFCSNKIWKLSKNK